MFVYSDYVCVAFVVCFFFFFKQKTAYEMRISDWSSDVCSSDLRTAFQHISVFENARFGRVLTLDGVVQTTERDEFCYHEMIVHVPMVAHGDAKRSEERRVGKEGVSTCRSRRATYHSKKNISNPHKYKLNTTHTKPNIYTN